MAKEVLIYGDIQQWTAANFINDVNSVDGDLTVRIDTNGGDPQATYGMVAKFNEFEGSKKVKIDGRAYSSGFFFAAMVEDVEALSVSKFMVHRAAYPDWYEAEYMTEVEKDSLIETNKDLKKGFESKVNIEKFEEIAGVTVKEVFSMDSRIDVFLTAKQAKQIGLINKVIPITSKIKAELDGNLAKIAARYTPKAEESKQVVIKTKIEKMTIEKLKAEHPEIVSAIEANAVAKRNDQIGSWLPYLGVDAKAVSEGINSGSAISETKRSEFSIKMHATATLAAVEAKATPPVAAVAPVVKSEDTEQTEKERISALADVALKIS